jgi:hypothetical protein
MFLWTLHISQCRRRRSYLTDIVSEIWEKLNRKDRVISRGVWQRSAGYARHFGTTASLLLEGSSRDTEASRACSYSWIQPTSIHANRDPCAFPETIADAHWHQIAMLMQGSFARSSSISAVPYTSTCAVAL